MTIKLYDVDGKLIDRLYQWDCNRYITLSMGDAVEPSEADQIYFHFSNSHTEEAYSVKAIKTGDRDYEVMIPNELFMYDDTIFMYIFRDAGEDGRITIGEVKLPLTARSMPSDYVLKDSPGVIRIANGLVAVGNIVYLARDGVPFGAGAEAAPDVGFGATGDATMMRDGAGVGIIGSAELVADNVVDLLSEPYASSLQNAAANTSGGLTPQTNRICCVELVDFPSGGIFSAFSTISGAAAQVCVWLFDADGVYLDDATNVTDPLTGKRYNQYTENGTIRTVPTNAAKMRVVTRLSTNADIAISDLSAFNITFY